MDRGLSKVYYQIVHRALRLRLRALDLIDQDQHGADPNLRMRISVSNAWMLV